MSTMLTTNPLTKEPNKEQVSRNHLLYLFIYIKRVVDKYDAYFLFVCV